MSNQRIFSSPDLQKALESARPHLEGAEEARNKVSEDIKALEAYLQGLPLHEAFRFQTSRSFDYLAEGPWASKIQKEIRYPNIVLIEHYLVFGPDPKGKPRLQFETLVWEAEPFEIEAKITEMGRSAVLEFCPIGEVQHRECKPLIEQKWEIRIDIYSRLPEFLKALGESTRVPHVSLGGGIAPETL